MPIGLDNIGWKMYMVNGSWDIVITVLIVSHLHTRLVHSVYSVRSFDTNHLI